MELARATGAEDLAEMSKLEMSMTRFSALKKRMAESQAMALSGGFKAVKLCNRLFDKKDEETCNSAGDLSEDEGEDRQGDARDDDDEDVDEGA